MKLQYRKIELAKAGDIVEFYEEGYIGNFTHKNLYIVRKDFRKGQSLLVTSDDRGSSSNGHNSKYFKLVKTIDSTKAKIGDKIICMGTDGGFSGVIGKIYTVDRYKHAKIKTKEANWFKYEYCALFPNVDHLNISKIYERNY